MKNSPQIKTQVSLLTILKHIWSMQTTDRLVSGYDRLLSFSIPAHYCNSFLLINRKHNKQVYKF